MNMKMFALWINERNVAIKSQDVEKFKAFYQRWKAKGFYTENLPSDIVIEVSLRKMLYNLNNATPEEKEKAKEWLEDRGCTTEM